MGKQTAKKCIALCMALIMTITTLSISVCAEAGQQTKSRFDLDDSGQLYSIDLSDQIHDLSTVNTGVLFLELDNHAGETCAIFDPIHPGVVHFGWFEEDGSFDESPLRINGVNYAYVLVAAEGNLYDDVSSFEFTVKDVLDEEPDGVTISLPWPSIAAAETDGDMVTKLTMDFTYWTEYGFLLDAVDMEQEIALTVILPDVRRAGYRAVPISYNDSVLTVNLYDGNQVGAPLHGLTVSLNDVESHLTDYVLFEFSIPSGFFRYGDTDIQNANETMGYYPWGIKNIPSRNIINVHVPEHLVQLGRKMAKSDTVYSIITKAVTILSFPFLLPQVKASFDTYGANFNRLVFKDLYDGVWKYVVRGMLGHLLEREGA